VIPTFAAGHDRQDISNALIHHGAVIVESLLESGIIDAISDDLRPAFDHQGHVFENDFNGYSTRRLGALAGHSETFGTMLANPVVVAAAEAVLKPNCEVVQVGSTSAIEILPGEKEQVLHRDDSIYPVDLLSFELQISALWALDDFSEENGATRIVMGTSDLDALSDDDSLPVAQAIMPQGSVVMYLGSTIHGGGANHSSQPRKAVVNTYALGWLRQEENQYLALSPEAVASQSDEVQRLLGFQAHGPHLGVWPDDPDGLWFDS